MNILTLVAIFLILQSASANTSAGLNNNKNHRNSIISKPFQNRKDKYFSLNTFKKPTSTGLTKRDYYDEDEIYEDIELGSTGSMYYVETKIGSNEQMITAQLDTGSSDFWVFSDDNIYCGYNPNDYQGIANCEKYGVYDFKSSETFELNNTLLLIGYGDTTEAKGIMGTDNVSFGDFEISNMSFGVISLSNSSNPVMGIGFKGLQSVYDYNNAVVEYNSLPYIMADQNIINIPGYSISLLSDETDANSTITFGAIDTTRYNGQLYKFPVPNIAESDEPTFLAAVINELTFSDSDGTISSIGSGSGIAIFDTGSTNSYFPEDIFRFIGDNYFQYNSDYDIYYTDCESCIDDFLIFNFQGVEYSIPLSSFIISADEFFDVAHPYWEGYCIFNVDIYDDNQFLLGDSFLKNVYLVADLENGEIALGSSVGLGLNDITEPCYVEMEDSIPEAINAPDYSTFYSEFVVTNNISSTYSSSETGSTDYSPLLQSQKKQKKSKHKKGSKIDKKH